MSTSSSSLSSTSTRATDTAPEDKEEQLSAGEVRERKQRILTHGTPSITSSIADAVVIKDENVFLVTSRDGGIPLSRGHGFGLYYHDCRYLRGYELCIAGASPTVLASTATKGDSAIFQLANQDIRSADGQLIPKETIGVKWARSLHGSVPSLHESRSTSSTTSSPSSRRKRRRSRPSAARFSPSTAARSAPPAHA